MIRPEEMQAGVVELIDGLLDQVGGSVVDAKGPTFRQKLAWTEFVSRRLYVQTKQKRLVLLDPNRTQRAAIAIIERQRKEGLPVRIICCKCRQGGFSTIVEAYLFTNTVTHANTNTLVAAHELKSSEHLFGISKRYYDNLGEDRPSLRYASKQEMVFDALSSRFIVDTAHKKSILEGTEAGTLGRSFTFQNFHASEIAFWENAEVVMDAVMGSIPDNEESAIFLESTGNTTGDYFYTEWVRAREGRTEFTPLFVPWFWVEEYARPLSRPYPPFRKTADSVDLEYDSYERGLVEEFGIVPEQVNWLRHMIQSRYRGNREACLKNFPSREEEAFSGSHSPYFDMAKIRALRATAYEAPLRGRIVGITPEEDDSSKRPAEIRFEAVREGPVGIWSLPVPSRQYVIGSDIGEGIAYDGGRTVGSYSCSEVFDRVSLAKVASWHGHVDPDAMGDETYKVGRFYNDAWVGVEVNNHGLTTLTRLRRLGYPRIYFRRVLDEKGRRQTKKIGWLTTFSTREHMLSFLVGLIRDADPEEGTLPDPEFLQECSTFLKNMKKAGRGEPATGCFSDRVMAAAIALAVNYYIGLQEKRGQEPKTSSVDPKYQRFGVTPQYRRMEIPWHLKRQATNGPTSS